ncbi:MAG: hypothetical protein R3Y53_07570, partial [Bacillota bacterium]
MDNEQLKNFAERLYGASISEVRDKESNAKMIDELSENVIELIPQQLYRFRSCTCQSLDALKKDAIWGSLATSLNDPTECMPCYDIDRLSKMMNDEFNEVKFKEVLKRIKADKLPDDIKKSLNRKQRRLSKKRVKEYNGPLVKTKPRNFIVNFLGRTTMQIRFLSTYVFYLFV